MAGKHRNLKHVSLLRQRREITHLHILNHALSKSGHGKLLCEMDLLETSGSIVSQ
jgi:hypothetical protein